MKLYEIGDEYLRILEAFEFAETEEEIAELESQLKSIDEDHETKAKNICAFVKTLDAQEKQADAQRKVFHDLAQEWAKKRDARKNKKKRVSEYLLGEMKKLGFSKRKYGNFSTWIQETAGKLEYIEDMDVPDEYTERVPVDSKVKDALVAGEELEFAKLTTSEILQIR
jgi:hypothetical protein